jgi:hypothetical protein
MPVQCGFARWWSAGSQPKFPVPERPDLLFINDALTDHKRHTDSWTTCPIWAVILKNVTKICAGPVAAAIGNDHL